MPINDDSVDYFQLTRPITIGNAAHPVDTTLPQKTVQHLELRYDGLLQQANASRETKLSADDPDGDNVLQVGDSFTISSALYNNKGVHQGTESVKLTLLGAGTFSSHHGVRDVLIGEAANGAQYVVFPRADAPTKPGQVTATIGAQSAGYDFDGGKIAICYLEGTGILTESGEVAIEDLREGDLVVCRFGGLRPARWIGRQRLTGSRAAGQEAIRIATGALADNMPRRPLFVSPGHAMLVAGRLVLAADLVNGITITREEPRDLWSYVQLDLGEHDLLLADGAWSESFADCGDFRTQFDNFVEFRDRFPDHVAPAAPRLCAPRPEGGEALHEALRHTARRALSSGATIASGRIEGRVEGVAEPCHVSGWVMDADHPGRPVMLELVLGDEVIATTLACAPRRAAGDQGRMGFIFAGDPRLSTRQLLRATVRRAQDGQAITPLPSAALGTLQGHLDLVTDSCRLEGWARDETFPQQPVMLEVVLGDEIIGTVLASRAREDLRKAGLGDTAFVFEASRALSPAEMEAIQLRRISDRAVLRRTAETRIVRTGETRAA
ncbi:tRNA methyltransferase [Paracoccus sp. S-4012]|uniref:Hint domain-containing protein n=1 Tax=Paracoccus sp. S-4012 TaxID=2665648 RepID=UPI0012AFE35F|nr:Hint domain-containing protein [Paracoccus sp. S-4012]MRX51155.1 tRNA methyltransferase [Paracoccus sp. S-4012]